MFSSILGNMYGYPFRIEILSYEDASDYDIRWKVLLVQLVMIDISPSLQISILIYWNEVDSKNLCEIILMFYWLSFIYAGIILSLLWGILERTDSSFLLVFSEGFSGSYLLFSSGLYSRISGIVFISWNFLYWLFSRSCFENYQAWLIFTSNLWLAILESVMIKLLARP